VDIQTECSAGVNEEGARPGHRSRHVDTATITRPGAIVLARCTGSEILFQPRDGSRDGRRIIAQYRLQISSPNEFVDDFARSRSIGSRNDVGHLPLSGQLRLCRAIKRRSKLPQRLDNLSLVRTLSLTALTKKMSKVSAPLVAASGSAKSFCLGSKQKDRRVSIAGLPNTDPACTLYDAERLARPIIGQTRGQAGATSVTTSLLNDSPIAQESREQTSLAYG
jgi:hypothetical protein